MSTKERIDSSCANKSRRPVTFEGRTRARALRRTQKLPDASPQNQKLHHEPSDAQPPRSDEDRDGAEAPSSTIDHLGPSTSHQLAAIGGNSPQPVNRARVFAPSYSGSGLPDARSIWRKCL